jgi:hypothetical protein
MKTFLQGRESGRTGTKFLYLTILVICLVVAIALALSSGKRSEFENVELRSRLRDAREARIADLEDYVKVGAFPHNHDIEGERVPYLIDRHGRLCAVAYLFASSNIKNFNYQEFINYNNRSIGPVSVGLFVSPNETAEQVEKRKDLLAKQTKEQRVLAEKLLSLALGNNQIRVMEVKVGGLMDWILASGLTIEECALIQPSYSYLSCNDCLAGSGDTDHGVTFGQPTQQAVATKESENRRIRNHLNAVINQLRRDTELSLNQAMARYENK